MSDKSLIQKHSEWVAEKVAEARELGVRDGVESLSVAHVIANLYFKIEQQQRELKDMTNERDLAEAQLKKISELPRLVPDIKDWGDSVEMVSEEGYEPFAYIDADEVRRISEGS